ncbi:MAG: IS3 family transposase [Bacteroidota bacterium]|nr:IS3 family transposase [Bacteroidota bacterium]
MCQVLEVSKSGYYRRKKQKDDPEEKAIADLIISIYNEHKQRYGYRRIHPEIKHRGLTINKKRVAQIMYELGLKASRKQGYKKTTNSRHSNPVSENLLHRISKPQILTLYSLKNGTGCYF